MDSKPPPPARNAPARPRLKAVWVAIEAKLSRVGELVAFCCRHAPLVVTVCLGLALAAGAYSATHFSMNTETDQLMSPKLGWRVRETAFNTAFPPQSREIVVVIDGRTPELTEAATARLAAALARRPDRFDSVRRADGGDFWSREGLLYASTPDVKAATDQIIKAQPFLGPLAADPSLRGLMNALATAAQGVKAGQAGLADLDKPMAGLDDALGKLKAGQPAFLSWRQLISGKADDPATLRHIILIGPKIDYAKLAPAAYAITTIRSAARDLGLDPAHGVRVRLTGNAPVEEDELGSLGEGIGLIGLLALGAILLMLWLAVRSPRIITAILITMFAGLACTMAGGLLIFHRFNVISVAFIPLFVGLGIDFGIQLSVRYRHERTPGVGASEALIISGRGMGRSLALAAAAIAAGFLAFAPTQYVGVSQLGLVAGFGMLIALALNLTLLPALLNLMSPPGAPDAPAGASLEKLDAFMLEHRRLVVGSGIVAAAISAALLPMVHFDFNPLHLRSSKVESMTTLVDLSRDPDQTPNTLSVLTPNLAAADQLAAKLSRRPEVAKSRTLSSFIPEQQAEKLAIISDADTLVDLTLNPLTTADPPTDAQIVESLKATGSDLRAAAGADPASPSQHARALAGKLDALAAGPPASRQAAAQMLIPGLNTLLDQLRATLQAQPVTLDTLPADVVRDWRTPDGRAQVTAYPRGDSNNNAVLTRFIAAVASVAPNATGLPMSIVKSGDTVVGAFVEAGILSFIAITLILFIVLRRARDVAITMAPIVLTGLLTMGSCVVIGQPLNFANIIALPLLFGIGVAFHIYFVMAWRSGGSHLLTSSLTRAIFFSALTTATGFGSLWASSHPGTASMGKLLMISLLWTLVSALLFQPALMGPPPGDAVAEE